MGDVVRLLCALGARPDAPKNPEFNHIHFAVAAASALKGWQDIQPKRC
jgi:hypothetical protein